jgi:uncharacterized protein YbjT (DUF2867 family)
MIAVMGAAGNVGGKVADRLLREERQVRVLEHHRKLDGLAARGATVVGGDAVDHGDLRKLFDGAGTALVLLPEDLADPDFTANRSRMSAAIADALAGSDVRHVVVLSTVGAGLADAFGPPAGLRELEQRLSRLEEIDVLVLRSGFYMENLLAALPMVQSQNLNGSAIDPDLPIPMIASRDVAAEAAARLLHRDVAGRQVKLLLGPEDVTMATATRAIGDRLGLPGLPTSSSRRKGSGPPWPAPACPRRRPRSWSRCSWPWTGAGRSRACGAPPRRRPRPRWRCS